MANPYYNPTNFNPYLQYPYPQAHEAPQQAFSPQGVIVQWVMGKQAAKAFFVPTGRTAFLFDTEKAVFYEKSVDKNGVPLPIRIHPYGDISDEEDEAKANAPEIDMSQYVRRDELEQYIKSLASASGEVVKDE